MARSSTSSTSGLPHARGDEPVSNPAALLLLESAPRVGMNRTEVEKSPGYRPVVFSGGSVAAPYHALATELLRRLAGATEPAAHADAA